MREKSEKTPPSPARGKKKGGDRPGQPGRDPDAAGDMPHHCCAGGANYSLYIMDTFEESAGEDKG